MLRAAGAVVGSSAQGRALQSRGGVTLKVDVAINYYGKPYQTMLTVESLLEQSAQHVDLIYIVEELEQPREDVSLRDLLERHSDRMRYFTPRDHIGIAPAGVSRMRRDAGRRLSVRYQYPLETTDKPYMLVTHNDVLYTGDLVGELLRRMEEAPYAGAGRIGQCWNCFAFEAGVCDGDKRPDVRLSYFEALRLKRRFPSPRCNPPRIHIRRPLPLPECRLNEFACLLDVGVYRRESLPVGSSLPFGCYDRGIDLACSWFRSMVGKGYSFANVHIWDYTEHDAGHPDLFDPSRFEAKEQIAKELLRERGLL